LSAVADVVVVGAGLAGAAAAWELARRDREVVVLERFEQGHGRGSSHGTERIVRLGYTAKEYVELALHAIDGWRELEEDAGETLLHPVGAIDAGYDDELEAVAAAYRGCGVRHEWLEAGAARERWPGMRFDGPVLHQPDGGWVWADRALEAFLASAARHGADVQFSTPVVTLEPDGDGVRVITDGGSWSVGAVVVAAGAWAPNLLDGLVDLPSLTVTQEQVAYFEPREASEPWPCFIHRAQPLLYGLPGPSGRIKVGEHQTGPVVDPDDRTFDVEPEAWQRLLDAVDIWLPGVSPEPVDAVTCLYATAPDDDLVIDRVGPVVVAAGLGGHGFKFGPALGRMLADLVDLGPERARARPSLRQFGLGRGAASAPGRSGAR
jgi:sarcosine oxidase